MSEFIIGLLLAIVLFLLGSMTQAWKKLVQTFTAIMCKIFPFLEKRMKREKQLKMSQEFKQDYSTIEQVKRSNIGMKRKKIITVIYFVIFIVSLGLIVANLKYWSPDGINLVTNWLSIEVEKVSWLKWLDVNTTYTAVMFSLLSFSLTSLLRVWKEGSASRKEKRQLKRKNKVLKTMSSAELAQIAVEKSENEKKQKTKNKVNIE